MEHGVIFSRTTQHMTIIMCNIWWSNGTGKRWHILPTLQILRHVITGCLHVWKNICGLNDLNQKTVSTLLSLSLYIIHASMNTQWLLTTWMEKVCDSAGDSTLSRGNACKHSGIPSGFITINQTQNFWIGPHVW